MQTADRPHLLSLEEAFASLERMPHPPSVESLTRILHSCRKHKNPVYALRLHAYLRKTGLQAHKSLGNYLVPMLVEVGSMCDAQQVFDRLVGRNEYSWTSLITGYIQCGDLQHAFTLYQKMQEDSVHPNGYTFVALLKACAMLKDAERGQELHAHIARKGLLGRDPFIGTTLVDMYAKCGLLAKAQEVFDKLLVRNAVSWNALITGYAKCGLLAKAQEVFDKLPVRNAVSWTALIAGYTDNGLGQDALSCFEQMQLEGIPPDAVTFVCSLKACGSIGATCKGQEIHYQIASKGLSERNPFVGNTLVDMYAKCGLLAKAQEVFERLPVRDAVSWNALIAGYAEHCLGQEALNCLEQMELEGVLPDSVTFVCSLKACGSIGAIDKGQEIHAQIARKGLLERDAFVGNTLVDMYAKCGVLVKAQEVFDKLRVRDAVSWTALIAGFAELGCGQDALNCFEQMQLEGISPNLVTLACSLKACGSIGAIDKGRELHAQIGTKELLERDLLVGNTLVDMYAKCGFVAKAQEVFDKLPVRDAVSWNALIAGYAEHGLGQDALNCFEQMQLEGISPDVVTFVCSVKACGNIGAVDKGQELHAQIVVKGWLERDPFIGSSLVDMYAKCGLIAKAQEVFEKLRVQDTVSWNALIAGYAYLGESDHVFLTLDRMRAEEIKPDAVTFLSILTVCSHTGLVENGQTYFEIMSNDYGITPTIGHHTCMVDLLGRAGQLGKAVMMIKKMSFKPSPVLWHTVLGASWKWGNVELGRWAFEHAVELDKKDAAAYVLMSNVYANAYMQDTKQVEVVRLKEQEWKKPAQSWWIGFVHSLLVGDTGHSQSNYIYEKLEDSSLETREEVNVQALHQMSQDVSDDLKESGLCRCNEKLSIGCVLINTPHRVSIQVKNVWVCKNCDLTTSLEVLY